MKRAFFVFVLISSVGLLVAQAEASGSSANRETSVPSVTQANDANKVTFEPVAVDGATPSDAGSSASGLSSEPEQKNDVGVGQSTGLSTVYAYEPIRKGDQYLKLGLNLGIPLFNTSLHKFAHKTNIWPGGGFFLGYNYFLTKGFSLGTEISFDFFPTLGKNLYFAVPVLFTMGYTFATSRLRIPLTFGIGVDFQSYNGVKYFGMMFKPAIGFYYQYTPEWSFGGTIGWSVVPQWYWNKAHTRTGNILTVSLGVRYHF